MINKIITGKFTDYITSNGWEYIARKGTKGVVSIVAKVDNKLILIKQWREPVHKYVIEFPAGLMDLGELIETAAKREFKEETGYDCYITEISPELTKSAGITNETQHIVYANAYNKESQNLQDNEKIEVIELDINNISNFLEVQLNKENTLMDSLVYTVLMCNKSFINK